MSRGGTACDCRASAPGTVVLDLPDDLPYLHDSRSACAYHLPAFPRVDEALEDQKSIGAAQHRFAGAFRVRHQRADVPPFVTNPGDVPQRSIGIRRVGYL